RQSRNVPEVLRLRSKVRSCLRSERAWHGNDPRGIWHLLRFELPLEHNAHSVESAVGLHHHTQHASGRAFESVARLSWREPVPSADGLSEGLSISDRWHLRFRAAGCQSYVFTAVESLAAETVAIRLACYRFISGKQDHSSMART